MKLAKDRAPITKQRGHLKHMGMMVICCGLPLLLLLGIGAYGISSLALESMILLICPIGMGIMMWMMMRGKKSTEETVKSDSVDIHEDSESTSHIHKN